MAISAENRLRSVRPGEIFSTAASRRRRCAGDEVAVPAQRYRLKQYRSFIPSDINVGKPAYYRETGNIC